MTFVYNKFLYIINTYFCPISQHDSLAVILRLCWLIKIPFADWFFGELAKKLVKFSLPHDFDEFIIRVSINRCSYCERLRWFLRRKILRSLSLLDSLNTCYGKFSQYRLIFFINLMLQAFYSFNYFWNFCCRDVIYII